MRSAVHASETQAVRYHGRTVAICTSDSWLLSAEMQLRRDDDPERRFVLAMVLYALDVANGRFPGPYSDEAALRYARAFYIPSELLERDWLDRERAAAWLRIPSTEVAAACG
jgi:hypothetical protein